MMKVSDYVFWKLKKMGVGTVFTLTGGGIMHLVDSLGRSGMEYACCHHEQACAIAAQAYGMYNDDLAVCLVTTGPGGTNALTGTAAAYMDSTPVLFLSGQVKREDSASLRGVRQFGAQENDIISMARPVTKYAATVAEAVDIRYELEKAIYFALSGRKGPVWVDIPLDIQAETVDETALRGFSPPADDKGIEAANVGVERYLEALKSSERPLILLGHGAAISCKRELLCDLVNALGIPVMTTWRARNLFDANDPLFFGSPGLQAPRYSNLILQSCDLLLVLGSRLDNMITAFNESHFAYRAKKIIVDIDEKELEKFKIPDAETVKADCGEFLDVLARRIPQTKPCGFKSWVTKCDTCRRKFPLEKEEQPSKGKVDLYKAAVTLSEFCGKDDTVIISSTSRCNTAGHIAFRQKKAQKILSSMGLGSMGFALPSAVGAWFRTRKGRVVVLEGDGSFQLNIQELQTIVGYNIPAKIIVFNNQGYAAISTMQERNFDSRYVGCNADSGVTMPDLEKIARAYGLGYFKAESDAQLHQVINEAVAYEGAVICELLGSPDFDEIPKCVSKDDGHGGRISASLENPYPFLEPDELRQIIDNLTSK